MRKVRESTYAGPDASGAPTHDPFFESLAGAGDMGPRMLEMDWARTALGPIAEWPHSLKTAAALVLNSPVPVVMLWGPDGIMIYNDAYSVFAGGRHPHLLGSPVLAGWPEVADFNRRVMEVGLNGGTLSFRDEHLVLHRSGVPEDVWLNLDYSPIRDETGKPAGVLAIVVETTQRVVAERQVHELNEKLKAQVDALAELDRAKTSFFTSISHEFRTPLTLILGPTEDALVSPARALSGLDLETVYRNELRLLKLVNALLDISRIEAGQARASYEPVDLGRVTLETANAFRSAIERAGLDYVIAIDPVSEPVYIDHSMWERIVLNLLSNALKFTLHGLIELSLRDRGKSVELNVRDTGAGIAEEHLPHLFQRFHRIEGTEARTQEGSGIGLALVDELVRLHGGTVRVSSVVGKGSTFTVTLPKGAAHLPQDQITLPRTSRETPVRTAFVEEALRWLPDQPSEMVDAGEDVRVNDTASDEMRRIVPGRVVLADDNADMRVYLTRVLAKHWTVHAVANGSDALEAAREHEPDVVLTDVMMPGLDGFALLRSLRADARTAEVRVIVLSARSGEEARVEGLQLGADDYLVKPFSARELVARVNSQVTLSRHNRERAVAIGRLLDEQAALRRVATLVAQQPSPSEVFTAVTEAVGVLLGADLAVLLHFEGDGATTIGTWSCDGDPSPPVGTRFPLDGDSLAARIFETRAPARLDSYTEAKGEAADLARSLRVRSSVGAPILVEGKLWGALTAATRGVEPWAENAETRIAAFTELVATAIANAESREARAMLTEEQAALRRVATLVAQGTSPPDLFEAVVEEVGRLLPVGSATMGRFEPDGSVTTVASWSSTEVAFPTGRRWPTEGTNVAWMVLQTGQAAHIDDFSAATDPIGVAAREAGIKSAVGSPVIVKGRLWGVVTATSTEGPLPPDTEARLASFTELVATAIANAESSAELTASRRRIVAASDDARRRIERDLHDGTQQRLVSLGLSVRAAEANLAPERQDVQDQLSRVAMGLAEAVEDLQELSRGIHPPILSKGGLGPALQTLAHRSAIPVDLDITTDVRLAEPIEVAAYFVASEALANAAKHSDASRIDVSLERRDGDLLLSVRDDGVGGADLGEGSGLVGLRDRVEALGGTITIDSSAGQGTCVAVTLPIASKLEQEIETLLGPPQSL